MAVVAKTDEELERWLDEQDAKMDQFVADQYAMWLMLPERVEAARTIANRKVLADEFRDQARRVRELAIEFEKRS